MTMLSGTLHDPLSEAKKRWDLPTWFWLPVTAIVMAFGADASWAQGGEHARALRLSRG